MRTFKLGDLYTESGQTLQGSFSAVSTPLIARLGSFFSIFRDLQDFHSFAPLRTENFSKILPIFGTFHHIFKYFDRNFAKSWPNSSFFAPISVIFSQNFAKFDGRSNATPPLKFRGFLRFSNLPQFCCNLEPASLPSVS